jgi:hypothetical protein
LTWQLVNPPVSFAKTFPNYFSFAVSSFGHVLERGKHLLISTIREFVVLTDEELEVALKINRTVKTG